MATGESAAAPSTESFTTCFTASSSGRIHHRLLHLYHAVVDRADQEYMADITNRVVDGDRPPEISGR
jgi:hypothetical protein